MRHVKFFSIAALIITNAAFITAQNQHSQELLPDNFGDQAFEHIEFLAGMDHRPYPCCLEGEGSH